ncbi:MAG: TolC family protein [Bryobacterales bacterium]|nr:TolC family protein [Bryobacterales bacterium]
MRIFPVLLLPVALSGLVLGETRTMTLTQAAELALQQNPDLTLARLDEQKAAQAVREARDPFWPQVVAGSGLAYTNGYPMSIEGSGPSIFQVSARQFVFNRAQTLAVAQARENARAAGVRTGEARDDAAFRVADLFLTAERCARASRVARTQVENLEKVLNSVRIRVSEGHELPIEERRAELNLARARQRAAALEADQEFAERSLATVLGFSAEDRVRAAEQNHAFPLPESEEAAVDAALSSSKESRRLESAMQVKTLEIRQHRAARLPRLDLVAQYGMFSKFNNYEDFFRKFQRNNGQIGVSIQVPVLPGPGIGARVAQAEAGLARLRAELQAARNRIELDTRRSYQMVHQSEMARQVARLDLDLAREQVSLLLARMEEGRASLQQVEEARFSENEKWIAFYEAQAAADRAKLELLLRTGTLVSALR